MNDKENLTSDELSSVDRGDSVVSSNKKSNILVITFMLVVLGLLAMIVLFDGEESEEDLIQVQDESFDTGITTKFTVAKPVDLSPTVSNITDNESDNVNQAEELEKLKREQEQLLIELRYQEELQKFLAARRRSPMLIYDQSSIEKQQSSDEKLNPIDMMGNQKNISGILQSQKKTTTNSSQKSNASTNMINAQRLEDLSYIVGQGKLIGGILESAIQSDLPGMVRAVVSEDIYSENGVNILIQKGSRLIGEYRSGVANGQTRLFVIWSRLIRSDGVHAVLASPGTDPLGRAGLMGVVDNHYVKRFGASMLLSVIGALSASKSDDDVVFRDMAESFNKSAEKALENSINIPPTIHIDQGQRIKIFIAKDLNFKSVLNDSVASYD